MNYCEASCFEVGRTEWWSFPFPTGYFQLNSGVMDSGGPLVFDMDLGVGARWKAFMAGDIRSTSYLDELIYGTLQIA